tara:strand:- start:727 stop:1521 length:795 start_codon:yes stop_codon:yes gene_type:complete
MQLSFILPNKKEVFVRELLFKDLRKFSLHDDFTVTSGMQFLETFIITEGLNIVEKFLAFLFLREVCIGDQLVVGSKKGNVNVSFEHIRSNIGSFEDISEHITTDDIEFTFNYPVQYNLGDSDFMLSCIEKIKIQDEVITLSTLSEADVKQVMDKVPRDTLKYLQEFLQKNENYFNIKILEKRESIGVEEISINMLTTVLPAFIVRLFNCVSDADYKQMLFTLCKRIPDVNFLINSTYKELNDFYTLYKEEVDKQNQDLKNQNSS